MFFPSVLLVAHNVTEEGAWKKLSMLIVRGLKIVQHFDVPQRDTLNPVQVTPSPEYNTAKQGEARGINNLYIPRYEMKTRQGAILRCQGSRP